MLHRSFKAGKCKTSLKLAVARIKLLKNKRDVQIKQMKRDLAHLLETGQEKTAMIRVEHVLREEKTMAAYDFIDIYCELIVARLPIIESQKNCPMDLKEAVCSIIFASPRCADIPELLDVRKHFTAKYGKDFATSSLELRPDCGVNRTLVENLSARAPNGETKLKILSEIAQEHNITWDPKAFGEKELKPHEDLLNGPRVASTTSGRPAEPLPVHIPQNIQKPESSYGKNVTGSSQNYQTSDPTINRTPHMGVHSSTEYRASAENKEFEDNSSLNTNNTTPNRQNWNMEFKDATSAAQAAVESAERASLAARAAVELSSFGRVTRQYSGSHEPSIRDQRRYKNERESTQGVSDSDQRRYKNERESFQGVSDSDQRSYKNERESTQGVSDSDQRRYKNERESFQGVSDSDQQRYKNERESTQGVSDIGQPRYKNERKSTQGVSDIDQQRYKNERESTQGVSDSVFDSQDTMQRRSSHTVSSGSSVASMKDLETPDIYSQNFTSEVGDAHNGWETKQSEESDIRSTQFGGVSEEISGHSNSMKEGTRRNLSRSSSSFSDYNGAATSVPNVQNDDPVDPLFVDTAIGSMQSGTKQASFNDYHNPIVFDESISDDETTAPYGLYNSSQATNSPPRFSANLDAWSPGKHRGIPLAEPSSTHSVFITESHSPIEFAERINRTSSPSQSVDLLPATFDDSDGIHSGSEEEREDAKFSERTGSSNQLQQQNSFTVIPAQRVSSTFSGKEARAAKRTPLLHSSSDGSDSDDAHTARNQESKLNVGSESWKDHGKGDLLDVQPSAGRTRASNSSVNEGISYSPQVEEEEKPLHSRYSLKRDLKTGDDIVAPGSPANLKDSDVSYLNSGSEKELDLGSLRGGFRNKGYVRPPYRAGFSVVQQVEETTPIQKQSSQKSRSHVDKKMSSKNPKTIFDSDSDEAEVFQHHTGGSRGNTRGRISRKTSESLAPDTTSISTFASESSMTSVSEQDGSIPQNFHTIESPSNAQTQARTSGSRRSFRTNNSVQRGPEPQLQSRRGERRGERPNLPGINNSVEHQTSRSTPQTEHYSTRANTAAEHQPSTSTPQTEQTRGSRRSMPSQSSAVEQSSSPPGTATTETSRQSSLNKESASRENSLKKASHVHPKLPDYDSFAAHFESLKSRK